VLSDQWIRWCCIDRLSWHDLPGLSDLLQYPRRSITEVCQNPPGTRRRPSIGRSRFAEHEAGAKILCLVRIGFRWEV